MSYLGLDIGTTGCKAVIFDEQGKQLACAYREYAVISEHRDWAELDPEQVWRKCTDVIKEAVSLCRNDPVRGIGISSQGEAFTPIGDSGEILGNAMVSSDSRAADLVREWSDEFGRERLYRITGHTPHPIFTLFKLLWLKENRPDVWLRTRKFYCFEEFVQHKLGLDPAISWPLAGRTMMFDIRRHEWSADILDYAGIDRQRLARTLPSGTVVGTISPSAARELGIPDNVIVVTGGHDQPCGALGAGITRRGRAVYSIGTVECITPAFEDPILSDELFRNNLASYDYTVPGMYTTVAYSLTGGNILKWYRDEWGQVEALEAIGNRTNVYEYLISKVHPTPTDLLVLPYFTPSGTPYFDVDVKGAILGLRLSTGRAEVLRALLEGVAFEMRLNLELLKQSGIHIEELVAIGGGAKSSTWLQLKADVLDKPICRAVVTEAGCMGVAMLACSAETGEDIEAIAQEWVQVADVVEPDVENARYYDEQFEKYVKIYPALRALCCKQR